MPIRNERELEAAVSEFQRLAAAPADSPDGRRRDELDAEIKDFYVRCSNTMKAGKPPSDPQGPG